MEIYKELNTSASKEFEKLLNSQFSKTKIEEGKIIEGKITMDLVLMEEILLIKLYLMLTSNFL